MINHRLIFITGIVVLASFLTVYGDGVSLKVRVKRDVDSDLTPQRFWLGHWWYSLPNDPEDEHQHKTAIRDTRIETPIKEATDSYNNKASNETNTGVTTHFPPEKNNTDNETSTKPPIKPETTTVGSHPNKTTAPLLTTTTFIPEQFLHVTEFEYGFSGWDFTGELAKLNLDTYPGNTTGVPHRNENKTVALLWVHSVELPWLILRKNFQALQNISITISFYSNISASFSWSGEALSIPSGNVIRLLFDMNLTHLHDTNGRWSQRTIAVGKIPHDFSLSMKLASRDFSLVAIDEIFVEGWTTAEVPFTTPRPVVTTVDKNATTGNVTEPPVTPLPGNLTTLAPTTNTTDGNSTGEAEGMQGGNNLYEISAVAKALWDAFYVFLALFCACILTLMILIGTKKCKNDETPPAVATYSPRTASYQLDKSRTNRAYETDSV